MKRTRPSHPRVTDILSIALVGVWLHAGPAAAQGAPHERQGEAVAATAPEREGGVVRGSVIEAGSRRPVSGATVRLVALAEDSRAADSDGATRPAIRVPATRTATTDAAGAYRFDAVGAGRWRIEVNGIGYRAAEVWIELPDAWEVRRSVALVVEPVDIEMVRVDISPRAARVVPDLPATPRAMVTLPVEATAAGGARSYTMDTRVLDPRDLPGVGALGEPDVFRALQRLPGISGRGDFSAGVWTRGAPWGMTQVSMDGLPLYDPLHLGGIAAGMAADGLGSVTIMPGVRPPSGSVGATGTIALTTRPAGAKPSVLVGVSSMASRVSAEDRWSGDRVGLAVTARRSWWDVIDPPDIFTGDRSDGSVDYRFADVSARFDARLGPAGTLELGGLWEEDLLYGDIRDLVSSSRGRWGNRMGWARLGRSFGAYTLEAGVGGVAYDVATRPMPWYAFLGPTGVPSLDLLVSDLDYRAWHVRAAGRHAGGHVRWAAGAEGVAERLEQTGLDVSDRGLPGVEAPAGLERERLWGEVGWALGAVDLTGGAGVHLLPERLSAPTVTPSVRARWTPADWLRLEAATGDAIQFVYPLAPTGVALGTDLATAYEWVMAGEDVPALASRTWSMAGEVDLPHDLTARVSAWSRRIDGIWMGGVGGVSIEDPRTLIPAEADFGAEEGLGLEFDVGWRNERATADVGYTIGRSHLSVDGVPSWPSPSERRHALDLHAAAAVNGALQLGADLTVESGWPIVRGPSVACPEETRACIDLPEGEEAPTAYSYDHAPAYASLDLKVRWERSWSRLAFRVTGTLRNALGRNNMAAFRSGTCQGAELISPVCEVMQGMAHFSPGLTRPTPSMALSLRF